MKKLVGISTKPIYSILEKFVAHQMPKRTWNNNTATNRLQQYEFQYGSPGFLTTIDIVIESYVHSFTLYHIISIVSHVHIIFTTTYIQTYIYIYIHVYI